MDGAVIGAIVAGFGGLLLFMLNKIYENKNYQGADRRTEDQSLVGIYSELLHITTTITQIDGGMAELIRRLPTAGDGRTKTDIEDLRKEFQTFRAELNKEIMALSEKIGTANKKE